MVATALRQAGYDVLFVGDANPRMSDAEIVRIASEQSRIIITMDLDFGEMVFHLGEPHAGVLLLRMPGARAAENVSVVEEIVAQYGDQLPQRFSVYRNGRLRIRG
jgi:predicted nuclease of predicted toxin-antitoxin system